MRRSIRLTKTKDFQRVRQFGETYTHPLMLLIALPNQQEQTRIGIVAGKAVGKAVQRNRAKRWLRSAVHKLYPILPTGWDLILIVRRKMLAENYQGVETALRVLLQQAGLLSEIPQFYRAEH